MIHPEHFGFPTNHAMFLALKKGNGIAAKDLLIGLESQGSRICFFFAKKLHHTLREYRGKETFELSLKGFLDSMRRLPQEMYYECAIKGFQVEDQSHRIHERTEYELLEWREAKNLVDSLNQTSNTRWYIKPIDNEKQQRVATLGNVQTLIESLQYARDLNLNTCTRAELISFTMEGMIVADKAQWLAEELSAERKKNIRATRLRESGKEVMTISREEYEDLFNHAAVLKAMIEDPRFTEDMSHILSTVEVDELGENGSFDATELLEANKKNDFT